MMINLNRRANVYHEEKLQKCQEYSDALEEERRKIQVFQRELPLSLQLVTQAIETCKQQITSSGNGYNSHGQSQYSEQTSSEGPVLDDFIPIKRLFPSSDDDEDQQHKKPQSNNNNEVDAKNNNVNKASENSDWLRSAQLWNQSRDPNPTEDSHKVVQVVEVKRDGSGGAFHLFKKGKSEGDAHGTGGDDREVAAAVDSSSAESSGGGRSDEGKKQGKEGQSLRKQRRSWSPELHNKFLDALQHLGGSHVATPKQIKELMSVDGLTNDEVKSHLQKYRLHTRRTNPSNNNSSTTPTYSTPHKMHPQFMVVGGLCAPPPEHTATASTSTSREATQAATARNGIYAPISTIIIPTNDSN